MFNLNSNSFFNFKNPDLSAKFHDWNWKNSHMKMSVSSAVGAIIYLFYYQINRLIAPEEVLGYMFIVQVCVLPLILFLTTHLSLNPKCTTYKKVVPLLALVPIVVALTVFSIMDEIQNKSMYLIEVYFIIFWVFTISGIRFLHATFSATIVFIISLIATLFISPLPVNAFIFHIFWMSLSFGFSFFIAYKIEYINKSIFMAQEELITTYVAENLRELEEISDVELTIKRELSRYERYHHPFSVLTINIENFREIGDEYGRQIQALVLVELSILIKQQTRLTDLLIPLENHDLFILYQETNGATAMKIAEKLQKNILNNRFTKVGNIIISIAVVSHLKHDSVETILERNEDAMKKAKLNKKGRLIYL